MQLTLVVTIDPVKSLSYLDVLVHALNVQTRSDFDVVFYNQTTLDAADILAKLRAKPQFAVRFVDVPPADFLGTYPIWDLYGLHARLVDEGPVGDYIMALHMEEFPDADYVEELLGVLERERLDILFGNLTRTRARPEDVTKLFDAGTPQAFDAAVTAMGLKECPHWSFDHGPVLRRDHPRWLFPRIRRWAQFGFRKTVPPTPAGYTPVRRYLSEDVFAMSVAFARRYNWFLRGHRLWFEDIHIFGDDVIGHLTEFVRTRTRFPLYFNRRRIYHLEHGRFYFQFEDETFTSRLMQRTVDDPVLGALQHAVREYREGRMTMQEALTYSRRNPARTGTQNLNYDLHRRYLENPPPLPAATRPEEAGR